MSSDKLTQFYGDYKHWVDIGAPVSYFARGLGLCSNLLRWCKEEGIRSQFGALQREMHQQFIDEGMNQNFPFNEDKTSDYWEEKRKWACWTNSKRYAWVSRHAPLPEADND